MRKHEVQYLENNDNCFLLRNILVSKLRNRANKYRSTVIAAVSPTYTQEWCFKNNNPIKVI